MNPRMNHKVAIALLRAQKRAREIISDFYEKQQPQPQPPQPGQLPAPEQAQPEPPGVT